VNKNMCSERRLLGNVVYFATFSGYGFLESIILFEFGHSSASARDAVAAVAGTLCAPECAT